MEFILVGVGCGFGAMARYFVSNYFGEQEGFPKGTFFANFLGSFLLGIFYGLTVLQGTPLLIFLTTGFCGGFTTFSTFSYEVIQYVHHKTYKKAIIYGVMSIGS